jgi:hypothetical protein
MHTALDRAKAFDRLSQVGDAHKLSFDFGRQLSSKESRSILDCAFPRLDVHVETGTTTTAIVYATDLGTLASWEKFFETIQ